MRALTIAIVGIFLASGCAVADSKQPTGAMLWTATDLRSVDETLTAKMGEAMAAYTQVINGGTYGALVIHREVTADPELHVKMNDFFVVLSGEGEIKVGGTVTGEKTIRIDEMQGQRLDGGVLYDVKQGDILFVPANHWHQVIVAKGKVLRAIVIKAQ